MYDLCLSILYESWNAGSLRPPTSVNVSNHKKAYETILWRQYKAQPG